MCTKTFKVQLWGVWTGFVSGCKVMMGMCEHSNESLGSIKSRYILSVLPQVSQEGPCIMNLTLPKIMKSREEICTEQLLWVRCNEKQLQQGEHILFHVWCCAAITDRRCGAFTELYKFREGFSGSTW